MKQELFRKTGLSALAVAAVLAFWPAPSQAQDQGGGQGQERAGERRGGEGRGGGGQRGQAPQGGPGAQQQQRAPRDVGRPPAMSEQRQERAPERRMQERAVEQRREMAPRQSIQRQQSQQRLDRRQGYSEDRQMNRRPQAYQTRRALRDGGYDRRRGYAPGFVFLGGPRVVVRGYGTGWCRGLHRGRHFAPRIGWHAGTHRGLFRC